MKQFNKINKFNNKNINNNSRFNKSSISINNKNN